MPEQQSPKQSSGGNNWKQIGQYSHLALVLPASVVVGIVIGAALDQWLKTSWITIAGLLIGSAAGIIELVRGVMKVSKDP